ncbi:MAG: preprotein translocase subunit SecE [Ileibacterium sp.]|nr:preprotein translocase subunit SecE [Ileibacterium sp.]
MMDKDVKDATYAPKAVLAELKKVQWPTMKELFSNSLLVIVFTLMFGLYFFICEMAASGLISWIVSL